MCGEVIEVEEDVCSLKRVESTALDHIVVKGEIFEMCEGGCAGEENGSVVGDTVEREVEVCECVLGWGHAA